MAFSTVEQDTRYIINNNLKNRGWILDKSNPLCNVDFESPRDEKLRKKLKGTHPDYILYETVSRKPIGVIEAKKEGVDLKKALIQAEKYAEILEAPLIFAMNGAFCETRWLKNKKPLVLNDEEVKELLREQEAIKFLKEDSNEIFTIPKEVVVSRKELMNIFNELNNTLRGEGLRAGIERLSEFANILFLKLLSENERQDWWSDVKDQKDTNILGFINGYVIEEIRKKYGGDVFTPLQISNSRTLRTIINKLDPLILSTIDTDIKGDAFEYFLQKATSTNNDLGEYFTPRHIIKTMVHLVNPIFKEKVYDPFCGTGGFLTEAFKYIKENTIIKSENDEKTLRKNTIFGGELTTTARIAKMNMILQGDGHSGIEKTNSLTSPKNGEYNVIVSNIPFSQTTEAGSLYYNGIAKNNADAICVLHCLKALKDGGRMAIIVPEGFLFKKPLEGVRRFLLENSKLQTVISLPQGVFLPYTNVKTDILYFTNVRKERTNKHYFYFDVRNDGYSLDNQRKKLKGQNDLQVINFTDFKKEDEIITVGFKLVNIEEVKKNNYNLVARKYNKQEYSSKYPLVKFAEVIDLLRGPFGSSIKKSVCISEGYKVYEQGNVINNDFSLGEYYLDEEKFKKLKKFEISSDDVLITCAGTIGRIAVVPKNIEKGIINSVLMRLRVNKNVLLPNYLKLLLESSVMQKEMVQQSMGTSIKNMRPGKELKELLIPVPPLNIQEKIIQDIENESRRIEKLKKEIKKMEEENLSTIESIWGE